MSTARKERRAAGARVLTVLVWAACAPSCTGTHEPSPVPVPQREVPPPAPVELGQPVHPFDVAGNPVRAPATAPSAAGSPSSTPVPTGGRLAPSGAAGMGGWAAPPVASTPGMGAPPDMPPPIVQFTEAEVALYSTLSPLPPLPPDETNAVADDPLAAELGRALFEDPEFSGPLRVASELGAVGDTGQVSCGTCHFGPALDDFAQVSTGTGIGTRNSLSLVNSAFQRWTNWGGRFSAQWELSVAVIENPNVMNGTRLRVAHRIADAHRTGYEAEFGPIAPELADLQRFPTDGKPKPAPTPEVPAPPDGPWEAMTDADRTVVNTMLVNYGKAIAAFLRTIVSRSSPFDRFVAGERDALDPFAQAGLRLFMGKARCITCHNGPLFSDEAFHNIGVPTMGAADDGRWKDIPPLLASGMSSATPWSDAPDSGRLAGLTNPPPEETRGQFRTPSLRGVAQSAPYMHNGWFSDLRSVVDHYDWGGGMPASGQLDRQLVPLHLTDEEKEQLVAFLHSLTGEPVDSMLAVGVRPTW